MGLEPKVGASAAEVEQLATWQGTASAWPWSAPSLLLFFISFSSTFVLRLRTIWGVFPKAGLQPPSPAHPAAGSITLSQGGSLAQWGMSYLRGESGFKVQLSTLESADSSGVPKTPLTAPCLLPRVLRKGPCEPHGLGEEISVCVFIHLYILIFVYLFIYIFIIYFYIYMCLGMNIYVCINIYVWIYLIYIYTKMGEYVCVYVWI